MRQCGNGQCIVPDSINAPLLTHQYKRHQKYAPLFTSILRLGRPRHRPLLHVIPSRTARGGATVMSGVATGADRPTSMIALSALVTSTYQPSGCARPATRTSN